MKNITLKVIGISAVMALALCFTACNGDKKSEGSGTGDQQSAPPIGTVGSVNTEGEGITLPETNKEETTVSEETTANENTQAPEETTPQQTEKPETELSPIATTPSAEISPVVPPVETASAAADTALAQVGKMFKLGGASPEQGFDNSGLVYYALTQNGINCPRTASEMSKMGEKITADKLKSGDIAFFNMDDAEKTLFVALYIGDGKAVISTDENQPVKIVDINSVWYKNAFAYGISTQG